MLHTPCPRCAICTVFAWLGTLLVPLKLFWIGNKKASAVDGSVTKSKVMSSKSSSTYIAPVLGHVRSEAQPREETPSRMP